MVLSKPLRFFCFLFCIGFSDPACWAVDSNLAALKTAFVFNFIKFIDWPAPASEDEVFHLCLNGVTDELEKHLLLLNGNRAGHQEISVTMIQEDAHFNHCEMVFIGQSIDVAWIVDSLKYKPVVTVSDQSNFVEQWGMLELVEQNNRLNYKVNLDAARLADVHIKAPLLKLAQKVIASP